MNLHDDSPAKATLDFDPAESGYDAWSEKFATARKECPVFWSEAHGGYWTVANHESATRVARDWQTFSSQKSWDPATGHHEGGNVIPSIPGPAFIPVETDPPLWKRYRLLLNPFFAPKAAERFRPIAEEVATALMDRVIEKGSFDIVKDFSNPVPALTTLKILGIPFDADNWERFADPFHKLAYARELPEFPQVLANLEWIRGRLAELVDECRRQPREGLFNTLCHAEAEGASLSKQELVDIGMMLMVGGVGTTNALFANTMIYLDQHRGILEKLVANPGMLPLAIEEFVRFFSPVSGQARLVKCPVDVGGQHMQQGEQLLLALSSANRDGSVFSNPDEVMVDRMPNPHIGFGGGNHRCLGSFFAREMFSAMFWEMTRRMPDYTVDHAQAHRYPCVASVNGWIAAPARFTPGKKVGSNIKL
jgi:cytochrome P450